MHAEDHEIACAAAVQQWPVAPHWCVATANNASACWHTRGAFLALARPVHLAEAGAATQPPMGDEAHTDDGADAALAAEQVSLEPAVVTVEGGARPDGAVSTSDGASGGSSGTWGSTWFKGLKAPAGGGGAIGALSLGATMSTMGASMRKGGEALRERMAAAVKDVQLGTSNNLEAASAHAAQLKGSLLTSFTGPTPQYVALRRVPALPPARTTRVHTLGATCRVW